MCQCEGGFTHARNSDTIAGCPVAISSKSASSGSSFRDRRPQSSSASRPSVFRGGNRGSSSVHLNRLGDSNVAVRIEGENACFPDPCGENTHCTPRGNRAVCACVSGYRGDPYTRWV